MKIVPILWTGYLRRRQRPPDSPTAIARAAIPAGNGNPMRAKGGGARAPGIDTTRVPGRFSPSRATSWPRASKAAEIPVFAARSSGSPSSTARIRAAAKCWRGPVEFPNQASLVTLTIQRGRSAASITSAGKIAS